MAHVRFILALMFISSLKESSLLTIQVTRWTMHLRLNLMMQIGTKIYDAKV